MHYFPCAISFIPSTVPFPSAVSGMVSRALEEVLRTSTLLGWDSSADIIHEDQEAATVAAAADGPKSPRKPGSLRLESATSIAASGRKTPTRL